MAKVTDLKAIKNDKVYCELTFDQIDEVNLKINHAIATLDIFKSIDLDIDLNIESLHILTYEAYDKLIEVKNILNREIKG